MRPGAARGPRGGVKVQSKDYVIIPDLARQVPEIPGDSILSRTLYSDEQVRLVLFAFAAGEELSPHTAETPAIIHIVQGKATLRLGDDTHAAEAGTWVHMPAQLMHGVRAETPMIMELLLLRGGTA